MYGLGRRPVRARFFASNGWYCFRRDCKRAARQFAIDTRVRTRTLCLPQPVRFGTAQFHMSILRLQEQWAWRHGVTIRWMLALGFSHEIAVLIALYLVGPKLTVRELAARLV